ncbi:MAG: ARMT1-like domain-containing protein [Lachnospiraceae bacterium]|nr:ARMT1-like domain-containing protein [Lachnospiraceae bacterium]
MRISELCAKCLYDRQKEKTDKEEADNSGYMAEVKALLDNRSDTDTSPYMVYKFNQLHIKYFGGLADYSEIKKKYNDLVLEIEDSLRNDIKVAADPLAKALIMARIGNYIDFGAMNHVSKSVFMELFKDTDMREDDKKTYDSFLKQCEEGNTFLLICDNCGEIVLDKLMLEALKERFPHLKIRTLVRGGEVLNDATMEDAVYTGLDKVSEVITNGEAIAGTIYEMMPEDSKKILDESDVILAKGQGNYESMSGQGRHVFYEFLCKCDLFTDRFNVPRLTGMFVEE